MATDFPGVALVTGAGGCGIGAAIAKAFAVAGCTRIVITDYNEKTLAQTEATILAEERFASPPSSTVLAVHGDISSSSFVDELFEKIKSTFGRLDYAVNCAGISGNNLPSSESAIEDFDRINGVNYKGLWMCSRIELQIMKDQKILGERADSGSGVGVGEERTPRSGSAYAGVRRQRGAIVNVASQLGVVGRPDAPIYCASKSAVIGLTRADAIDASPHLIRVNAICPGVVLSPMTDNALRPPLAEGEKDMQAPMELTESINIAPMKRMGLPEEIADIVLFLCSEKASFVQGAAWVADGGYTIN